MIKKIIGLSVVLAVLLIIYMVATSIFSEESVPIITYQSFVKDTGWQNPVNNGEMSGTSGQNLELEAIKVYFENPEYDLSVRYATFSQNAGWQEYNQDNQMSGTGEKLEGIRIQLEGADADKFDVYYQVHEQLTGWMGWAKNWEKAGSEGVGYRMEAFRVVIVPAGSEVDLNTKNALRGFARAAIKK